MMAALAFNELTSIEPITGINNVIQLLLMKSQNLGFIMNSCPIIYLWRYNIGVAALSHKQNT